MGMFSWLSRRQVADPKAAVPKQLSKSAVGPLPLSIQFQRIGGNLTPQQVSSIIVAADVGDNRRLIDLSNEARQKDCHLHSVLQTRELSLNALEWQIVPADDGKRRSQKCAEMVEDALKNCATFSPSIEHLQGAPFHGYDVEEVLWIKDGRYIIPGEVCHIHQRRLGFHWEDGVLKLREGDLNLGLPTINLMTDFPAGKFIQHQPRINGDVQCREGLARVLVWAALFRNWDVRDWMQLGEMGWKPTRIGSYKRTANDEDIEALEEILSRLTTSGWATKPDDCEIQLEWPKGNGQQSTHKELADFMGAEMSKATLGQTLTTEAGKNGARSLGDVHDRVRRDILEADARAVANTINKCLIGPMCKMNFGNEAPCIFKFVTAETVNVESFANAMDKLAPILKLKATWARSQIGADEPDEDDELVGTWSEDVPIDPETGLPLDPDKQKASGKNGAAKSSEDANAADNPESSDGD
jgi:phage gp29-like protein